MSAPPTMGGRPVLDRTRAEALLGAGAMPTPVCKKYAAFKQWSTAPVFHSSTLTNPAEVVTSNAFWVVERCVMSPLEMLLSNAMQTRVVAFTAVMDVFPGFTVTALSFALAPAMSASKKRTRRSDKATARDLPEGCHCTAMPTGKSESSLPLSVGVDAMTFPELDGEGNGG